ncbi:polysaccharide biosynthesis C-terminal domain-containing protein [Halobacteriovorax sp. ZH5_bin.2]|uniref:polysaccharide biosynthesis C-terminal domain-containing protein n=1 Tax=Halobacteriovorax sp. ZH5_bin.2 TaxID=3157727 RepID=UPI0037238070
MAPIYTYYISPEAFGQFSTVKSFLPLFTMVSSVSIDLAYFKVYFDEGIDRIKLLSTALFFLVFSGIVFSFIFTLAALNISFFKDLELLEYRYIYIFFTIITIPLINLANTHIKAIAEPKHLSKISIITSPVLFLTTLGLLEYSDLGVNSIVVGIITQQLLQVTLFLKLFKNFNLIKFDFSFAYLKLLSKISIPMIPTIATGWINTLSDRFLLTYFGLVSDTGIYSIAFVFSQGVYFIGDSISKINAKISMQAISKSIEEYNKNNKAYFENIITLILLLIFLSNTIGVEILPYLLSDEYSDIGLVFSILTASTFIGLSYRPFTYYLLNKEKIKNITYAGTASALCNTALNIVLIPKFGKVAAATTTIISNLVYFLIITVSSREVSKNLIFSKRFILSVIVLILSISYSITDIIEIKTAIVIFGLILLYLLDINKGLKNIITLIKR